MAIHNRHSRLRITSSTKLASICRPTSKAELRSLIDQELKRQGPDANLNFIDTSAITDMSFLFVYKTIGNIKIDQWDTSNVRDMHCMFAICKNFEGKGLENWDVSNVEHMSRMFEGCENLNVDLSNWDIANVRDILLMFYNCKKFRCNLSHWDLSKIHRDSKKKVFQGCDNQPARFRPKIKN